MLELRPEGRVATQTTVLPQLVARASVLELSQEELEECVAEKLDQNPALELATPNSLRPLGQPAGPRGRGDGAADVLARLAAPVTLRDDLCVQLRSRCEGRILQIAQYLVESLDHRGYLTCSLFEVADDLEVSEQEVKVALAAVQELDPPGLGARDLPECLRLQVLAMPASQVPEGLLEFLEGDFARLVAAGDPRALRTKSNTAAHRYLEFIRRRLCPYPADLYRAPFGDPEGTLPGTSPDAVVHRGREALEVTVPMSERLALRVNAEYERLSREIDRRRGDTDEVSLRDLVAEARSVIANLTHRHQVIARVAQAVVAEQEAYLTGGPRALKPLTKKELAAKLRMHESTVCRATRGKTVMLPDGEVVPFDVFFEDSLPAKVTLANLIRHEDAARPYHDHDLVALMRESGYDVARRTVSKYRAALGIPSASERRRTGTSSCLRVAS